MGEPGGVLPLAFCFVVLLCALAVWAIAKAAAHVMDRLQLDPMVVLVWLGLAEWPIEPSEEEGRRPAAPRLEPVAPMPG